MISKNTVNEAPSGMIVIWSGATCPDGYTRFIATDDKFLVGSATYSAAAGGAASHTHTMPSHTHSMTSAATGAADKPFIDPGVRTDLLKAHTHGAGSGTSGSGGSGTTDSQSNSPLFAAVLLCQKD